jgi:predicted aspartyl protease
MPKFHLPIINNQLIADVWILNEIGAPIKAVKALFDTGAMGSHITSSLAKELNLNAVGKTDIVTGNGTRSCNKYRILLGFPFVVSQNQLRLERQSELEVSEIPDQLNFSVIIGMDIIQQGILIVDKGNYIFCL